jgi:hypothetical protein
MPANAELAQIAAAACGSHSACCVAWCIINAAAQNCVAAAVVQQMAEKLLPKAGDIDHHRSLPASE